MAVRRDKLVRWRREVFGFGRFARLRRGLFFPSRTLSCSVIQLRVNRPVMARAECNEIFDRIGSAVLFRNHMMLMCPLGFRGGLRLGLAPNPSLSLCFDTSASKY